MKKKIACDTDGCYFFVSLYFDAKELTSGNFFCRLVIHCGFVSCFIVVEYLVLVNLYVSRHSADLCVRLV